MIKISTKKIFVRRRYFRKILLKDAVLALFCFLIFTANASAANKGSLHTARLDQTAPPGGKILIQGAVKDDYNKPVEGASVAIRKLGIGTLTDAQGRFQLNVPSGSYTLDVSHVGMKPQQHQIVVGDHTPDDIFIVVPAAGASLNEVVVVGYGTQSKRNVTGSISSVKSDEITDLPVSNPATALQGKAAGVNIVRDDGTPGSTPAIRIRGTGTLNNSEPLIIIDGVPATGLNDVNSNDIASIEILKDASSSAIYGSRAANGVVIVTTKKGGFNQKMTTNINLYGGMTKAVKYIDMLTAPDLAKLKIESYTNDGLTPPTIWSNPYYSVQRTNWQRALLGTGHTQNADIAIRGGNASSIYSFSGNYYNENGLIPNSVFTRYSFRISSEHKLSKRIRVGENILYSNSNMVAPDTRSTQTGLVWTAIRFNPAIPVLNPDGSYGSAQADNQLGDINNPVAAARNTDAYNRMNRLLANGYAEAEIIPGLKIRANYAYDNSNIESYSFTLAMPDQTRGPSISSQSQGFLKNTSFLEEYFLTYNKLIAEKHDINFVAGYSAQIFKGNNFSAARSGYTDTDPNQRVLNAGASASNSGNNADPYGLQSVYGRLNYAYDSKYLLTLTMRADGSSNFAPGKQWGYFPAFSAGWRISDENFYGGAIKRIFNSLKLVGGWGELGNQNITSSQNNQNIGSFQYLNTLTYSNSFGYALGTTTVLQNGTVTTQLANPYITWEHANMTNIGLEFSTLANHLSGSVTYFNKTTTKMLILDLPVETFGAQHNLPDDGGNIGIPNANTGALTNKGLEVELNYQNNSGAFKYSFGANGSYLTNKVTALSGNVIYIPGVIYGRENVDISRTYVGNPIASFYGFRTKGLYQNQAAIDNDPYIKNDPNKANIKPGDVRFVDINGDGVINESDRTNLGNPNPKFIFGLHGSLSYKNFDLSFSFAGQAGVKVYNADRLAGLDATQVFNWYAEQNGRWHGEGTSNSIPRLSNQNLNNNYRSSDLWVENGAFLSLKNVALGYTFVKPVIGTLHLPDIRIYASSYNVFMITGYKGFTPELGFNATSNTLPNSQKGVDLAQYPSARNLTVGISANF